MRVAVPKETAPGERRVALVPETVPKLAQPASRSRVERGAGASAALPDDDYAAAGAELVDGRRAARRRGRARVRGVARRPTTIAALDARHGRSSASWSR